MLFWFVTMVLWNETTVKVFLRLAELFVFSCYVTPTEQQQAVVDDVNTTRSFINGSANLANNSVLRGNISTATMSGPNLEDQITGVYEYGSKTNFDNYLKELGVPWALRFAAGLASPTVTISRDNECQGQNCKEWTIHTNAGFGQTHQVSFNLGQPVNDTTLDGRNIQMTVVREDRAGAGAPVWRETQVSLDSNFNRLSPENGGKSTDLIRTFLSDMMTVDMTCGNVKASSTFNRRKIPIP